MKRLYILLFLFSCLYLPKATANNIQVDDAVLYNQNTAATPSYTHVRFDLTWDNSWRVSAGPANWDGAWLFVKYQIQGEEWKHATLSTDAPDHDVLNDNGTAMTIDPSPDGKGVFVHRSGDGIGDINLNDVLLRWNYETDGVLDTDNLQIKVFAIEMVYIPEGPFFVGDGNITTSPSTRAFSINNTGNNLPYRITSEDAITFAASTYTGDDLVYNPNFTSAHTLLATFPKGFQAFWVMKYEVTQKQYLDFFNTLPNNQTIRGYRNLGVNNSPTAETFRNNFYWDGQANSDAILTNGRSGDRACNYLSTADALAYADWSGLRPITEFEFEKMARGTDNTDPNNPVPVFPTNGEFAWGNTTVMGISSLVNDGQVDENIASPMTANAHSTSTINGPVRNGIFAAKNPTSDQRTLTGGSYYGVMELSGNLEEIVIAASYWSSTNNSPSCTFTGNHGDGELNDGRADVNGWMQTGCFNSACDAIISPNTRANQFITLKGGAFNSNNNLMRVSDRSRGIIYSSGCSSTSTLYSSRFNYIGFRAGRTAN
ncbi:MAG: hypothetical protein EA412_01900 [Chitinophagaceae bacterium]|nr:MAG: hypothetical protein EA412_01900 [Chitinophagaceae bacterium]